MARSRAKVDEPKLAAPSDWGVLALHRPIPHGLKRAIDYIRGHVNGKMSIADLVAHCGVPERTLRKHFRAFIAVSPLTFWRQLRLAAARACLLEGSNDTSITEVAARFGFGHFGRFAQDYRRHFGETPSETLRRSRLERHEREDRPRNHAPTTPAVFRLRRVARETDLRSPCCPCRILRPIQIAEHSGNTLPRESRQSCVECAPFQ